MPQSAHVVQEGEIAHDNTREGPRSERNAGRCRNGSIDARESSVCDDRNFLAAHHAIGHTNKPRCAPHQPVVRPCGPPHTIDQQLTRQGRAHGGQLCVRKVAPVFCVLRATLGQAWRAGRRSRGAQLSLIVLQGLVAHPQPRAEPLRIKVSVANHELIDELTDSLSRVEIFSTGAHHDGVHVMRLCDERGNLAPEGGMTKNDDALDSRDELFVSQGGPIVGHKISTEPRSR
ncbi:unannotated protein [freshwater metagenome]|uniref:Unannotated protein n=1 Tax=freshwater metagenome TaxID=449393 RepID=A0A6J7GDS0_9ZZZZ